MLFWDEPETNLNPKLMKTVVSILVELHRMGVQILIATHDYVTLKEFDLATEKGDDLCYHSLYRDEDSEKIDISSTSEFLKISPNAIDDAFGTIIDREIDKSMEEFGK